MSVAGFLRGPLRDVEAINPARQQGPVPAHLLPRQAAAGAPASPPPPRPIPPPPGSSASAPEVRVARATAAPVPPPELRAETAEERKRRLDQANVKRSRARRRGEEIPREPHGPRELMPTPPCPNGCEGERAVNRGTRHDGKRRWRCRACGCTWTVEEGSAEVRRAGPSGRRRTEMPDRPDCPSCGRSASSMGSAPNGRRRLWLCRDCGKRWSTEGPVARTEPTAPAPESGADSPSDYRAVAAAMGRKGGRIGAARRMASTTPEQRSAAASHASRARWATAGRSEGAKKAPPRPNGIAGRVRVAVRGLAAVGVEADRVTAFACGMFAARYGWERAVAWAGWIGRAVAPEGARKESVE